MMMRHASCCLYENPVTKEKKMMMQQLCDLTDTDTDRRPAGRTEKRRFVYALDRSLDRSPMTREEIPSKMNLVRKCSCTYRLLVLAFSNNVFQRLMREMSEEEILANCSIDFATGLVSTARLKTEDSCCCWTTACHYYYYYCCCYCKSHP
jgi:hypothetical protein